MKMGSPRVVFLTQRPGTVGGGRRQTSGRVFGNENTPASNPVRDDRRAAWAKVAEKREPAEGRACLEGVMALTTDQPPVPEQAGGASPNIPFVANEDSPNGVAPLLRKALYCK